MADASQPLKWFFIYARQINGEDYFLADNLEPVRNRAYGVRVHPIKQAYEFVGCLQNRYGSTFDNFLTQAPEGLVAESKTGSRAILGGWSLEE